MKILLISFSVLIYRDSFAGTEKFQTYRYSIYGAGSINDNRNQQYGLSEIDFQLLQAVAAQNLLRAKQLIYSGANPLARATLVVRKGSYSNGGYAHDYDFMNPLMIATRQNNIEMMEYFVQFSNDFLNQKIFHEHPLLYCESAPCLEFFLKRKTNVDTLKDHELPYLLKVVFMGIDQKNPEALPMLKLLHKHGADFSVGNPWTDAGFYAGDNALHIAARSDDTELVAYLLEIGFDKRKKNPVGMTPYEIAIKYGGSKEVIDLLK